MESARGAIVRASGSSTASDIAIKTVMPVHDIASDIPAGCRVALVWFVWLRMPTVENAPARISEHASMSTKGAQGCSMPHHAYFAIWLMWEGQLCTTINSDYGAGFKK